MDGPISSYLHNTGHIDTPTPAHPHHLGPSCLNTWHHSDTDRSCSWRSHSWCLHSREYSYSCMSLVGSHKCPRSCRVCRHIHWCHVHIGYLKKGDGEAILWSEMCCSERYMSYIPLLACFWPTKIVTQYKLCTGYSILLTTITVPIY